MSLVRKAILAWLVSAVFIFSPLVQAEEIVVEISVSSTLSAERFSRNWPVHIYLAEPGSRVPLSSKTVQLDELPVTITLTDEDYVLPMFTLKGKEQLVLITKISSSGDPHKQGPEDYRQTSPAFSLNDQNRAAIEMVLEE